MSLHAVRPVQPGTYVQVGWNYPAYYFEVYEGENLVRSHVDLVTLFDLVEESKNHVDWEREAKTLAALRDEPWQERAALPGGSGPARILSTAFRTVLV